MFTVFVLQILLFTVIDSESLLFEFIWVITSTPSVSLMQSQVQSRYSPSPVHTHTPHPTPLLQTRNYWYVPVLWAKSTFFFKNIYFIAILYSMLCLAKVKRSEFSSRFLFTRSEMERKHYSVSVSVLDVQAFVTHVQLYNRLSFLMLKFLHIFETIIYTLILILLAVNVWHIVFVCVCL